MAEYGAPRSFLPRVGLGARGSARYSTLVRALIVALFVLSGCGDPPDARFATPQTTIATLLGAYGVAELSELEIQQHMRERGQFELRDQATFEQCFVDYRGLESDGLTGFVFGMLAARKDSLHVVIADDSAHVFPDAERRERSVVMTRRNDEWKISLHDSVPPAVRRDLEGLAAQARERQKRTGVAQ